jgi:hypothetical protein
MTLSIPQPVVNRPIAAVCLRRANPFVPFVRASDAELPRDYYEGNERSSMTLFMTKVEGQLKDGWQL